MAAALLAGPCFVRVAESCCCSRQRLSCLAPYAGAASSSVDSETLSGRERRRLKNVRREELKMSVSNWREEVEKKLDVPKKKLQGWEHELDTSRLSEQGLRWWMLQVYKNSEKELADFFEVEFAERFPGDPFEVLVPSVPCDKGGRPGAFFEGRKRLFPCIVLIRCVLNREKYNFFTGTFNVMDFFGHKAGPGYLNRIMPAPVSMNEIDKILEQVRSAEAAWKEAEADRLRAEEEKIALKERRKEEAKLLAAERRRQANEERRLKKMRQAEMQEPEPVFLPLRVGARIKATAGPLEGFTGLVVQAPKKGEKVKVYLTMFGKEQAAALDPSQVEEVIGDESVMFE